MLFCSALAFGWQMVSSLFAEEISFHAQVVPLLTRAGCNAGACHGAAAGRGGFHLSLFGSNPAEDYHAIVHQLEGRRIHRLKPTKSLILRKALGELDHGGGQPTESDSSEFATLKSWIEQGATFDKPLNLESMHVDLERIAVDGDPIVRLRVMARTTQEVTRGDAHEMTHDVTSLAQLTATDPDSVELNVKLAQARLRRPGRHSVIVRYRDRIQAVTLTQPFPNKPLVEPPLANGIIDREINATLTELNIAASDDIGDADFLRRVTLDLTGRLPGLEEIVSFVESRAIDKRQRAVDRLLASAAFNDHWTLIMSRWLRLHSLPNETAGAEAFGKWIHESIATGAAWSDMTRDLLTATGDSHRHGPANFCRMVGDARAHAEMVSEVFLGARMGCANCHDHPLDQWTQDDYHGLAAMLARIDRGRQVKFTLRGEVTHPKTSTPARWRLPGDRFVDENATPIDVLTAWITSTQERRLSQAFTNRLWYEMFGRGLVDPVDDLRATNPAAHPKLLDELSSQVVASGYDLRRLLRWIAESNAYARQSSDELDPYFVHHASRRLTAHALADAISDVTAVPIRFENQPLGLRAVRILDPLASASELDALGRCQRPAACGTGSTSTGLATQLHLINGELINRTLSAPDGRLMRMIGEGRSTREIVREFYLRAFAAAPSGEQLDGWVEQLDSHDGQERVQRLQDWLWSVLSSQRFQCNH